MKLVGSNLEERYRSELRRGHNALLFECANKRILDSIKRSFPKMLSAYILDWVPEQGEDIYTVLVDDSTVAIFELPRSSSALVEAKTIQTVIDYRRTLRKHKILKLLVALDLVSKVRSETTPPSTKPSSQP